MTTTKTKHTPGPWTENKDRDYKAKSDDMAIYGSDQTKVARIERWYTSKYELSPLSPEVEANARLIAAAPELLEALKSVASKIRTCEDCNGSGKKNKNDACYSCGGIGRLMDAGEYIQEVESAISKAEGES